jgi:TetR/AcrR family transcriptional regulator, mexJK operon transcriptional repressor
LPRFRRCGDLEENLVRLFQEWIAMFDSDLSALCRLVIAETGHFPELLQHFTAPQVRPSRRALTTNLIRLGTEGRLAVENADVAEEAAEHLAAVIIGRLDDRSHYGLISLPTAEILAVITSGVHMFLRAYRPSD